MRPNLLVSILCIPVCAPSLAAGCKFNNTLEYATDKKSANVYFFGSALFGYSTKPIYVMDVKLEPTWECANDRFLRLRATMTANASAEAPVDRSDIDPDSITAGLFYDGTRRLSENWDLFWEYGGWGEFARKHPSSNALGGGTARFVHGPKPVRGGFAVVYPTIGLEAGANLNRPAMLFKRPVDLSGYKGIFRPVGKVHAAYRLLADRKAPEVFRLVLESDYTVRMPLTAEPFVRSAYVPGSNGVNTRQKVVTLRRNARHNIEAAATWNLGKFIGLRTQYRYGTLPPLFEFVDHQVTIGFTFKGSL